jgi:hypothetical protein
MSGNRAVTTATGKGRVYQFIKGHFQAGEMTENPFQSDLPGQRSLWDLCQIWCAFSDATARFGSFDPDSPAQKRRVSGYALALSAYNEVIATDKVRNVSTDPYYDALRATAGIVLRRQIQLGLI